MNSDFARAMHRATASVRQQNLAEATSIIQAALSGRASGGECEPAGRTQAMTLPLPGLQAPPRRLRRPLGEVVQTLREGRRLFDPSGLGALASVPAARMPALPLPEGATFTWRTYDSAAGARRCRLFVPSCPAEDIAGLVVMLHGCKQDPDDFAAGTGMNALADANRLLVVYPAQNGTANVASCWNWFDPAHQSRDAGEPAILSGITREIVSEFAVNPDRVFVAGLSAGGAMAAVLAETHPDLFAAVGVHSGLPYGSANDVMSAFAAMRGQGPLGAPGRTRAGQGPRLIVFHGTADHTVHPRNAENIVAGACHAVAGSIVREARGQTASGRDYTCRTVAAPNGSAQIELWLVEGGAHAWSGGHPSGSYTDPGGPDASAEMVRFFLSPSPEGTVN
jgi:poly(hydroxyalkanoate) depolymerase family esterase